MAQTALKVFVLVVCLLVGAAMTASAFAQEKNPGPDINWMLVAGGALFFLFAFVTAIALKPVRRV